VPNSFLQLMEYYKKSKCKLQFDTLIFRLLYFFFHHLVILVFFFFKLIYRLFDFSRLSFYVSYIFLFHLIAYLPHICTSMCVCSCLCFVPSPFCKQLSAETPLKVTETSPKLSLQNALQCHAHQCT